MARLWRVFDPRAGERPDGRLSLSREEAHHVSRVLRLGIGSELAVFDGRGRQWRATVAASSGGAVELRLEAELRPTAEPPLEVELCQAVCLPQRAEWVVQKATELGARAIRFVECARAECRAPSPARLERWERIAVEACKQAGRSVVPRLELLAGLPAGQRPGLLALLLDPREDAPPAAELLAGPKPERVLIAVGPESGFTEDEVARAAESGWVRAGLGPRTLRTETAGLVALSLVLHFWGDLGSTGYMAEGPAPAV